MFTKGKDYIVKDGTLKIIDELTGRILEGRRYGDGLHQALEAKEKIEIQAEDGIRDDLVTGVQTCALPISSFTSKSFV